MNCVKSNATVKLKLREMTASAKEYFNRTLGNTRGCCGKIEWKKCLLGHEQPYDFITRRAYLGLQ